MANEFKVRKGLIVQGSGSTILDILGSQGELFSVTDSLVGSLFSVNDISGIPIMEVFSDNTIKMGTFNQEAIIVSGSRTGMGIATPQAELHISGANNDSLFRIQSPASASIMFVSGSGLVGIGTLTPTQKISVDNGNVGFTSGFGISWDSDTEWIRRAAASDQLQLATQNTVRLNIGNTQGQLVAIGLGTTAASAQFQVRGGGATAATTAMRIEDSGGNARLTILDNGTSAFNTSHLYISSSGRIGIGTATPTIGILDINGVARMRSTNPLYFGGTGAGDWQGAISGQSSGLAIWANLFTITNQGYASPATQSFVVNTSQNVAIGPHSPTARLHVSGASNAGLFEIDSPAVNNIIYVSGSGNVGIGTGTPTNTLQVVGGITATSITASIISASSGITASQYSGVPTFTYNDNNFQSVNIINTSNTSNALNGLTIYSASNAPVGQFLYLNPIYANSALRDTVLFNTVGDRKLGFVANTTTAAGANSDIYFQAGSTTAGRMIYISGQAGAMGIGMGASTPTSTNRLQVRGQGATSSTTALRVENSSAAARLTILDDGTSAFNTSHLYVSSSGLVGIGTTLPTAELHISGASADSLLRVGSPSNANILFVTGSGRVGIGTSTPSELFEVVRSSATKIVAGTNVGIQIATATNWIHLSSSPASNNYINIDAAQTSLPPTEQNNGAPDTAIGASANWNKYLTEPDYWMEIKLNGTIALIPCYNKG